MGPQSAITLSLHAASLRISMYSVHLWHRVRCLTPVWLHQNMGSADLHTTSCLNEYMKAKYCFLNKYIKTYYFFEVTFTFAGVTTAAKKELLPAKCKEIRFDIYVGIFLHNYFVNHKAFFSINICALIIIAPARR